MVATNAHLHWFKLKCPYPQGSEAFRRAKAKLDNATAADLERLRAEFELYEDGSIPVTHYSLYDEWFASFGELSSDTGDTTSWIAPSTPGNYSVTCKVSDQFNGMDILAINIVVE